MSRAGGVARSDDGDHRTHHDVEIAAHAEQRRCVIYRGETWRITGFARREQADADPFAGGKFFLGFSLTVNPPGARSAAPARQIGQPGQRLARTAKMIHKRAKGPRPDVLGTDQPQPVDPLRFAQPYA